MSDHIDEAGFDEILEELEAAADDALGGFSRESSRSAVTGLFEVELTRTTTVAPAEEVEALDDPVVGAVIDGRYKILETLRESVFGAVLEVEHLGLEQNFALKLFHPIVGERPELLARFLEAARSVSLLGHENIVFLTDFGECENLGHYLVLEPLDGASLQDTLDHEAQLTVRRTVLMAQAVGNALAAVYDLGLTHGNLKPSNVMSIRRGGDETWKLLDFGIASVILSAGGFQHLPWTPYMAPEMVLEGHVTHAADQYALASIVYEALTGEVPHDRPDWFENPDQHDIPKPSELREDLSAEIDRVVMRGLNREPGYRWSDVDAFVAALRSAAEVEWKPTIAPIDAPEVTRQIQQQVSKKEKQEELQRDFKRPRSTGRRSAIFRVDALPDKPLVTVEFRNAARLRREYRRNMNAGGLFIPTTESLNVRDTVRLELVFEPRDERVRVEAHVVSSSPGTDESPPGYGMALSNDARSRVTEFLRSLDIGVGLSPHDIIRAAETPGKDAQVTPGEAFLLSRLSGDLTLGQARSMFSSLPFEFDEVLAGIVEKGFVEVESRPDVTTPPRSETPNVGSRVLTGKVPTLQSVSVVEDAEEERLAYGEEDVGRVLERVEYFEKCRNYLSAIDLLEEAVRHAPDIADFHFHLARLLVHFEDDFARAKEAIDAALDLEPDDVAFQEARREIERLDALSAIRTLYEREVDGDVDFVRIDAGLERLWMALRRSNAPAEIHAIDYAKGRLHDVKRSEGDNAAVIESNPSRFASIDPADAPSESARRGRQKLLEEAQRTGEYGPWFREGAAPIATTPNSEHLLFDGHPQDPFQDGLHIKPEAAGKRPIRIDPGYAEFESPTFAPGGHHVAWMGRPERNLEWHVLVSPPTGPARRMATLEKPGPIGWRDDREVVVIDHAERRLLLLERTAESKPHELDVPLGSIRQLVISPDHHSALLVGDSKEGDGDELLLVDLVTLGIEARRTSAVRVKTAFLRDDGLVAATLGNGGFGVFDMRTGGRRVFRNVPIDPESLENADWRVGKPLVVTLNTPSTISILSIDAESLVRR